MPQFNKALDGGVVRRVLDNGDNTNSDTWEYVFNPVGNHGFLSGSASITELRPPANATKLLIQTLNQNLRFSLGGTGTSITAGIGFQILAGAEPVIIPLGPDTVVKIIQEASAALVQYQWGN